MIKKIMLILSLLVSSLCSAESISFRELVELASKDIKKNIYIDKNIEDYQMVLNIAKYQQKGEIFDLFEFVLEDNNMTLEYNKKGFYTVSDSSSTISFPAVDPATKIHFYTYKVKNITNKDVEEALSVMPQVVYKYLPQSDMIAYSATEEQHNFIKLSLSSTDNTVKQRAIKITIFYINKEAIKDQGLKISSLGVDFDNILTKEFSTTNSDITYTLNNAVEFKAYLSALSSKGYINIKQSPTMLLTNGVETSFKSVKNIPYISTTATVEDTKESTKEEVEYKDVGLQIKITPKIKNNYVWLDLNLISEEILDLNNDKPITQKIEYLNSVKVLNDTPILLTGLKKEVETTVKEIVPFFKNVPIFQDVFKHNSKNKSVDELNILIEVVN